jgi:hypothetical protein
VKTEYLNNLPESKPNLELSQKQIEKLDFEEMCRFVRKVLNCAHLNATDGYWANICGVSERWVRAWKGGKRVHIKHIEKIVDALPELIDKNNARVDHLRIWGARMGVLIFIKSLENKEGLEEI